MWQTRRKPLSERVADERERQIDKYEGIMERLFDPGIIRSREAVPTHELTEASKKSGESETQQ